NMRDRIGETPLRVLRGIVLLGVAFWVTRKFARVLDESIPVKEWLFWRVASLWLACLALSAACLSFGHLLLQKALRLTELPLLETLVMSEASGLVAFVIAMYAGGFLGLFTTPFAVILPSAMFLAGLGPLYRYAREMLARWRKRRDERRSAMSSAIAAAA